MTLKEYIKAHPDTEDIENIIQFLKKESTSVERAAILKSLANTCYLDTVVANWTMENQERILNQQYGVAPSRRKRSNNNAKKSD